VPGGRPPMARVRHLFGGSGPGASVAVQFQNAAGSLILQGVAGRTLGARGFGGYALLIGVLVTITTIQTSWVGDSLTVFDRFERRIRGAILISIIGTVGVGALVAMVICAAMRVTGPGGVGMFGLMVALWLLEETGRRVFTARMEFWRLFLNDSCYLVVSLATVLVALELGVHSSLPLLLAGMSAGATASIVLARLQLTGAEYVGAPLRDSAIREVVPFAWWRSIQAGIRPATLLAARILIVTFTSPAVLGTIEAARVLLSPGINLVAGAGSYLLGGFAKAAREGRPMRTIQSLRACVVLGAVTLVFGVLAIVFVGQLGPLLTDGKFAVSRVALVGWALYAFLFGCTMPLASLAITRRESRFVFIVRGVESVIGLLVLTGCLILDRGLATVAPYCLGGGGLVSATMLWYRLRRSDPLPAPGDRGVTYSGSHRRQPTVRSVDRSAGTRITSREP
jgi:O-antigen/teichoic acid export membrane protein